MAEIFHLADRRIWEATRESGGPYTMSTRDMTLEQEGFIHCSADLDQVAAVLARYYTGIEDRLVLLVIDPTRLDAELRYEPAGDELYPHIYGPLPVDAVIEVRPLPGNR